MPIVAAIMIAFAIVIGGIVLALALAFAVRDWTRSAVDIAARRRRVLSNRSDG